MPTSLKHLPDYRIVKYDIAKDAQLALEQNPRDHSDWIVISAFYQALHWVNIFLATKQCRPGDHGERNREVRNDADLKVIKENYKRLYDASRSARYDPETYENCPNEIKSLEQDLEAIINYITQLIYT